MKKEIEFQQENLNNLLNLMKDNPTLRVVPMVDSDIVGGDDYSCWLGRFGKAEVDEIWSDDERIYFRSWDFENLVDEFMESSDNEELFKNLSDDEAIKIAENHIDDLNWEKVISVRIHTP